MNRIAHELLAVAKMLTAYQNEVPLDEWEKMGVRGNIKYVRSHGGKVSPWKPGDGWKYVMEYKTFIVTLPGGGHMTGDSSEGCVFLAVFALAKKAGIDANKALQKAYGQRESLSELKEWAPLTKVPTSSNERIWKTLMEDLRDINNHSFASELEDALEEAGIL